MLKEVFGKSIYGVFGLFTAHLVQAVCQIGHQVVLEVLANPLRVRIEDILLLLAEHLNVSLGLTRFLLANHSLKILFLLQAGHFLE